VTGHSRNVRVGVCRRRVVVGAALLTVGSVPGLPIGAQQPSPRDPIVTIRPVVADPSFVGPPVPVRPSPSAANAQQIAEEMRREAVTPPPKRRPARTVPRRHAPSAATAPETRPRRITPGSPTRVPGERTAEIRSSSTPRRRVVSSRTTRDSLTGTRRKPAGVRRLVRTAEIEPDGPGRKPRPGKSRVRQRESRTAASQLNRDSGPDPAIRKSRAVEAPRRAASADSGTAGTAKRAGPPKQSAAAQAAHSDRRPGTGARVSTTSRDERLREAAAAGVRLLRQNQPGKAEALLRSALREKPQQRTRARLLGSLGKSLMDQGRYREAVGALRQSVELAPGHLESRRRLASAERRLELAVGQRQVSTLPESKDAGRTAASARPAEGANGAARTSERQQSISELAQRARRLQDAGRYAQAEPLLRRALARKPGREMREKLLLDLGLCLVRRGKAREALAPLARAAEMRDRTATQRAKLSKAGGDEERSRRTGAARAAIPAARD
jgi:tetratricopeptide (TPR) repeat protein